MVILPWPATRHASQWTSSCGSKTLADLSPSCAPSVSGPCRASPGWVAAGGTESPTPDQHGGMVVCGCVGAAPATPPGRPATVAARHRGQLPPTTAGLQMTVVTPASKHAGQWCACSLVWSFAGLSLPPASSSRKSSPLGGSAPPSPTGVLWSSKDTGPSPTMASRRLLSGRPAHPPWSVTATSVAAAGCAPSSGVVRARLETTGAGPATSIETTW